MRWKWLKIATLVLHQKSKLHSWPSSSSTIDQSLLYGSLSPLLIHTLLPSRWARAGLPSQVCPLPLLPSPVYSICHPATRGSWLTSKPNLLILLNSLQWLHIAKGPSPKLLSRTLNTAIICMPLQAHHPPLHWHRVAPPDSTACYPTRQIQASHPLFTLFQGRASCCPKLFDSTIFPHPSRLNSDVWTPVLMTIPSPKALCIPLSSRSIMSPQDPPSVISISLKYKPFEENMPYFSSCMHD